MFTTFNYFLASDQEPVLRNATIDFELNNDGSYDCVLYSQVSKTQMHLSASAVLDTANMICDAAFDLFTLRQAEAVLCNTLAFDAVGKFASTRNEFTISISTVKSDAVEKVKLPYKEFNKVYEYFRELKNEIIAMM